jgi:hypothetical protein
MSGVAEFRRLYKEGKLPYSPDTYYHQKHVKPSIPTDMATDIESENIGESEGLQLQEGEEDDERGVWGGWDDFLSKEDPRWTREKIIPILRAMLPYIKEWRDKPSLLYTLLSANQNLNIPGRNPHNKFIKNILKAAQSDEGLKEIEDYINSDAEDRDTRPIKIRWYGYRRAKSSPRYR